LLKLKYWDGKAIEISVSCSGTSVWIWVGTVGPLKSGGCEMGAFKKNNGFQPATILRRRIFTWMNCEIGGFHPV
jgi:hypothetical protein